MAADGKADFQIPVGRRIYAARIQNVRFAVFQNRQLLVGNHQVYLRLRPAAEHAGQHRIRRRYVVRPRADVKSVADGRHQRRDLRLGNIGSNKAVAVFVNADNMVAHAVMAGNGAAGDGVFQPAQKTMNVLHFDLGLRHVAHFRTARTFHPPDQHPAFGVAEPGDGLGQIAAVVFMQRQTVFAGRIRTFEVEKQLFGLRIDDIIVNRFFPEIDQLLKNIFGARHGLLRCPLTSSGIIGAKS